MSTGKNTNSMKMPLIMHFLSKLPGKYDLTRRGLQRYDHSICSIRNWLSVLFFVECKTSFKSIYNVVNNVTIVKHELSVPTLVISH